MVSSLLKDKLYFERPLNLLEDTYWKLYTNAIVKTFCSAKQNILEGRKRETNKVS